MKLAAFVSCFMVLACLGGPALTQQVTGQDIDKILDRADKLLDQAKAGYEDARTKNSVEAFVDAGFKLEEARIKYLVLQEIGSADKQKQAADSLRAVNQLSKLIHDGKVAITGSATDSPPVNPSDAPPSKDAAPNPVLSAARPAVDVSKRAPVPDASKQREAEKVIRELFKEQYSKKTSADRKNLIRLLLEQALKSQDDLVVFWVFCREAQECAVQICETRSVLESIEIAARVFDVDAMSMKLTALVASGKSAKLPEDYSSLADSLLKLIDELAGADLYDSADKAATSAVQFARKSNDSELVTRAASRSKEISEAKSLFQSMRSVLETLARSPEDPAASLEMGRYLCFVKGNWELGVRFIVKGSDPRLKALAENELAYPAGALERVAVADGWWDQAHLESSPLRKSKLFAHAAVLYESAIPVASELVRLKIGKRLAELGSGNVGPLPGGSKAPLLLDLGAGVKLELLYVQPGTFTMGGIQGPGPFWQSDERPEHKVTVSKGFYLGKYPVTRGQFASFVKATGYKTEAEKAGKAFGRPAPGAWAEIPGLTWQNTNFTQTDDHPVTCVTWNDAKAFCDWATSKTKRTVRLPTEADWEYACRAGSKTKWGFGDDEAVLGEYGWCVGTPANQTHPVGQKKPNGWGLYDMHGHVWQWCQDWDSPYAGDVTDPTGPANGDQRCLRGGSWANGANESRSAYRYHCLPSMRTAHHGFRVESR